ncbi:MAG: M48 family metallopeptidase [Alphaproteobacteria bacterium]|nr:M48 family metallopeptidase [Alphaproteobacteria bacterium]
MKNWAWRLLAVLAICVLASAGNARAQVQQGPLAAPTAHVEVNQLLPPGTETFDPHKAVDAYLSRVSPQDKARTAAYVNGGYVLSLVDVAYTLVLAALLLWLKISAGMRNIAAGITRHRFLQAPLYAMQYLILTTVVGLPLTVYEGYFRERAYGLSNQTLLQWAGDFGIKFVVSFIAMTILLTILYAVARAVKERWWVYGTIVTVLFLAVIVAIGPVYVAPLINHYAPLPDSAMKSTILSLAQANGIPAKDVYVFDASRQTKEISANVSGFLGTTRVSLTDNLLNRCTPSEVLAVVGHEMGHYVMNHVGTLITWFGLLFLVLFFLVAKSFRALTGIFGGNWDVRTIDDPAGLPLVVALFSIFALLGTPVTNTIIRTQEVQADIFGLNAVRQPDAFATVVLKLGEYRKLEPSPWEEFVLYDHPSGRTRIWEAMRWKAAHLHDPDILDGPVSPQ